MTGPGVYYVTARDGHQWLVVEILVDGDATVLGRWDDKAKAERECDGWLSLAVAAETRAA